MVNNHVIPTQIGNNFKSSDVFRRKMPTKAQLYNKDAAEEKKIYPHLT